VAKFAGWKERNISPTFQVGHIITTSMVLYVNMQTQQASVNISKPQGLQSSFVNLDFVRKDFSL